MGRPLRLLNITLGVVAVLIATALAKAWVSPAAAIPERPVPKLSQETTPPALVPLARPPKSQFDVIVEKNPFKQPPPMPPQRIGLQKPVPAPVPLPTLIGTILVDEQRRAMVSDKGKADIYSVNQEVAGGVITEIKEDRIMYKRGDESVEIFLKAAIETVPSSGGQAAAPAPASTPSLPMAPSGRLDKLEQDRQKMEKKLEKEQQKLMRKQFKNQ